MNHKIKEIKEYAIETIKERVADNNDYIMQDECEIHHDIFNTDYYIIGTWEATQWLGDKVFEVIDFIKTYENYNFGKVLTDFSSAEAVVNMYVYIIGEEIINDCIEEVKKTEFYQ